MCEKSEASVGVGIQGPVQQYAGEKVCDCGRCWGALPFDFGHFGFFRSPRRDARMCYVRVCAVTVHYIEVCVL